MTKTNHKLKKLFLWGTAMAMAALLMLSCNKNRFDFSQLDQVEGSGQWKLPIGSARASLRDVMEQLNYNGMIKYDADSNLYISYEYSLDHILSGSTFMTVRAFGLEADFQLHNDLYQSGITINDALKDTLYCRQRIEITSDSVSSIEYVRIESGMLEMVPTSNVLSVRTWMVSSPDITNPQWPGDTLYGDAQHLDLSGATFNLTNDSIILNYVIFCDMDSTVLEMPELSLHAKVELRDLVVSELRGHLISESRELDPIDTTFFLPMNVSGDIALKNTKLVLKHKNTFGGLNAEARIETLEFYGEAGVSPIFPDGFTPNLSPTGDEFVETTYYPNISFNTKNNSFRMKGEAIFNPGGEANLITVSNTSEMGIGLGIEIPFSFATEEGVFYLDTFDVDMSEIKVTDFINEVILHIAFDSQFPFNLNAQLYTLDDSDQITGQLLDSDLAIKAWSPGNPPEITNTSVSVTHESLENLLHSERMILKANLNTGGATATFNLRNSLGVTLKADVIYGGSLDINN